VDDDNNTPYEQMTDAELDALTDQVVSEHQSGAAPLRSRNEASAHIVGTVPISMRVPGPLLEGIKAAAEEQHMPYQRLMKLWLEEGLARNEPKRASKPVRLRLTTEQLARLRQSGLDIHLEAS
jgi:predicted DNA binding CopG/RHH family protein